MVDKHFGEADYVRVAIAAVSHDAVNEDPPMKSDCGSLSMNLDLVVVVLEC
jgi:hypothetical protein